MGTGNKPHQPRVVHYAHQPDGHVKGFHIHRYQGRYPFPFHTVDTVYIFCDQEIPEDGIKSEYREKGIRQIAGTIFQYPGILAMGVFM